MRIFLIVMLVVLLLLECIMLLTGTLYLEYRNGKFRWDVRVWGISLLPLLGKKQKASPEKSEEQKLKQLKKKQTKQTEKEIRENKKQFPMDRLWRTMMQNAEKADFVSQLLVALPLSVRTLCKGISCCNVKLDFLIANDDAAVCAETYGAVQLLVHKLLSSRIIRIRRKRVRICCDFTADACRWDFSFAARVRVGPVLSAAVYFLIAYLRERHTRRKQFKNARI